MQQIATVVVGGFQWPLRGAQLLLWDAVLMPQTAKTMTAVVRTRGSESSGFRFFEPAESIHEGKPTNFAARDLSKVLRSSKNWAMAKEVPERFSLVFSQIKLGYPSFQYEYHPMRKLPFQCLF